MTHDFYEHAQTTAEQGGRSLLMFGTVLKALDAEKTLGAAGIACTLLVPPPELRTGCDLAVSVDSYDFLSAQRAVGRAGLTVTDTRASLDGTTHLTDVTTHAYFHGADGARYLMVRAGNMKIAVACADGRIVNTSGGGCPDIPYLNAQLVGAYLATAARPRDLGATLCGLMLDRAFCEACRLLAVERPDGAGADDDAGDSSVGGAAVSAPAPTPGGEVGA